MIDYNCIEAASYDPMEIFPYLIKLCNFSQIYIFFFHPVYGAKNARENKDLMLPWLCAFRQWELNAPMVKASFCQIKSLIVDIMPKGQRANNCSGLKLPSSTKSSQIDR